MAGRTASGDKSGRKGKQTGPGKSKATCTSTTASIYGLVVVTLLHSTNTIQQYLLIGTISGMANDLHFGARMCAVSNETAAETLAERSGRNITAGEFCAEAGRCVKNATNFTPTACGWEYTGLGTLYDILAGPVYLIIQGIATVPMTIVAQVITLNHRAAISVFAILWSLTTLGTSFVQEYWTVAVLRLFFGIFSAPYFPFVTSYVTQLFLPENQAIALGILHFGTVLGYGISYLFIIANDDLGWRWCYIIGGTIGVFLGFAALTMLNPKRDKENKEVSWQSWSHQLQYLRLVPWSILVPILIAVSCRGAYSFVISYNINNYLVAYYPDFRAERYLTLVTVLVGFPGCICGGYLGDFFKRKYGTAGRLWTANGISVVLLLLTPVGFFVAPPPWLIFYACGIFTIDVSFAIILAATSDLVPTASKTFVFSLIFLFMNSIGGSINLLVTPLQSATDLRIALTILSEVSWAILVVTLTVACVCCQRRQRRIGREAAGEGPGPPISHRADETTPLLCDGDTN